MKYGKLYLVPTLLGNSSPQAVIPDEVIGTVNDLDHFAVENIKSARRFLKKLDKARRIDQTRFYVLNKKAKDQDRIEVLQVLLKGEDVGLMSEAGVPVVADPGSDLIKMAHENRIPVVPLTGPSSILAALTASGMQGQSFAFHGYLPRDERERKSALISLERQARKHGQTQIFIETPYRNLQIVESVVKYCLPDTLFCVAAEITSPDEWIKTDTVESWKKKNYKHLHKKPAVFLIG